MKKRGQVTLFIIVGITLVLIIGLFFYMLKPEELKRNEALFDDVPSKFAPVQNFVQSCIGQVGEKAVRIIGERGGYLYVPGSGEYDVPNIGLMPSFEAPTDTDSFYLFENGNVLIPYWYYMESPNNANSFSFSDKITPLKSDYDNGEERSPSEMSFEAQIDRYVNAKLEECLDSFSTFQQQGVIITQINPAPRTTTYIRAEDVLINVLYPINVNISDDVQPMKYFSSTVSVNLENTYMIAQLITKAEAEYHFLEKNLLNLIAINAMVNSKLLPPMSDFTFEFGGAGNTWLEAEVKENVKKLLTFTSLFQVYGSKNYQQANLALQDNAYETRQKVYDNMVIDLQPFYPEELSKLNLANIKTNFAYFDTWDIYFNTNSKGGEIKPKIIGLDWDMLKLGFQQYNVLYDVSWPVKITLYDTEAFNGNGFTFNFGLEGNVRDNQYVNSSYVPQIYGTENTPSICDAAQRTKNITVKVYDDKFDTVTGEYTPIPDVSVSIVIGNNACSLGTTGSDGILKTQAPSGVMGGYIKAMKSGYLGEFVSYAFSGDVYTIRGMRAFKPMNFTALKKTLTKINGSWTEYNPTPQQLSEDETVIATFTRIGEMGEEDSFTQTVLINSTTPDVQDFTDGIYIVDAKLLGKASPEDTAQALINLNDYSPDMTAADKEAIRQALSNNEGMPKGGVAFGYIDDNDKGNPITFPRSELRNQSTIVLYVLELKDLNMTNIDDLTVANDLYEITRRYQTDLIPTLR